MRRGFAAGNSVSVRGEAPLRGGKQCECGGLMGEIVDNFRAEISAG